MDIKEVLERIAKEARSTKEGFYKTDKLESIKELLEEQGSDFHLIHQTPYAWVFGKKEPQIGESTVLVSSHADIVKGIKTPYSEFNEETKYFKGTYDNLGTNAMCTSLMINEKDLPDNVYFAFTAEEETGRCLGAGDALGYIKGIVRKEPIVLALDVTDEGYENNRLFTIEGLHGVNEFSRKKMLEIFMSTEGEEQSFEVVRLKKKDDNSFLPEPYQNETLTIFDESVFFARNGCNSCSLCLPGEGEMHDEDGFYVKEGVMRGFEKSLLSSIYAFTNNKEKVEELKAEKDACVQSAKECSFRKKKSMFSSISSYTGGYHNGGYSSYQDALDAMSYNASYGYRSPEDYYYDENMSEEDFVFHQAVEESYSLAEAYSPLEFNEFFQDIVAMYGIEDNSENEWYFEEIFNEIQQMKEMWREDVDDDDIWVDEPKASNAVERKMIDKDDEDFYYYGRFTKNGYEQDEEYNDKKYYDENSDYNGYSDDDDVYDPVDVDRD